MNAFRRGRLYRRTVVAIVALTGASSVFVMLGGISLARSAIGLYQYGPTKKIFILKVSVSPRRIVTLRVAISGWKMYPSLVGKKPNESDGGHWVIVVDGRFNNSSANKTTGHTKRLNLGVHKLYVELANNDGSFLRPPVKSHTVKVTIRAKPPAALTD